jgi:hypothetical protein
LTENLNIFKSFPMRSRYFIEIYLTILLIFTEFGP